MTIVNNKYVRCTPVGLGPVQADREAADGTDEQIRTQSVVPARGGDMTPAHSCWRRL